MNKKIRLVVGAFFIAVAVFIGFFGMKVIRLPWSFGRDSRTTGPAIEARIVKGDDFLAKSEFFKVPEGGIVKAMGRSATAPDEKSAERLKQAEIAKNIYEFDELAVIDGKVYAAAKFGGFVIDANGVAEREFAFETIAHNVKIFGFTKTIYQSALDHLHIIQLAPGHVGYCSASSQGFFVYNENGVVLWEYGLGIDGGLFGGSDSDRDKHHDVLAGTVGDLDGDGVAEYIVAIEHEGVRAFNRDGRELWFVADDFPSHKLRVVDIDGNGTTELVEIGPRAVIRDGGGRQIATMWTGDGDNGQLVLRDGSIFSCDLYKGRFSCHDQNKKTLIDYIAPLSELPRTFETPDPSIPKPTPIDLGNGTAAVPVAEVTGGTESAAWPKVAFVKLVKDQPPFVAAVGRFIGDDRAVFYVYDSKGALRYHEVLGEEAQTIAVLPSGDGTEQILVGGQSAIWRYKVK